MSLRALVALIALPVPIALLFAAGIEATIPFPCVPKSVLAGAEAPDNIISCAEFWINRYQAGIAALLAFFAARVAWIKVSEQIFEARRQNEIASLQTSSANIAPLKTRVDGLEELSRKLNLSITAAWEGAESAREIAKLMRIPTHMEGVQERRGLRDQSKRLEDAISTANRHNTDILVIAPAIIMKKADRTSLSIAADAVECDIVALRQIETLYILGNDPFDEEHYRNEAIIKSIEGYASTVLANKTHATAKMDIEASAKSMSDLLENLIETTEAFAVVERTDRKRLA